MSNPAIEKLLRKLNDPTLMDKLVLGLNHTEFNSLMLEVFKQRAEKIQPSDLLKVYINNRFVEPAALDQVKYLESELSILKLAIQHGFKDLELSPLAPIGSCSAVGLVDQNKIVSALRGTEVLSDATNVLALKASQKRISTHFDNSVVNLCSCHRLVRAQSLPPIKGFSAHFKIFSAVTAGRDKGNHEFEKASMLNHLQFYADYLVNELKLASVKFTLKELEGNQDLTAGTKLFEHLHSKLNLVPIEHNMVPKSKHQYYNRFRFSIDIIQDNQQINIGDGGFVDWSQKITSNKKERMLISGLGLELLLKLKETFES